MRIEHISIWTEDLERLKDFYIRYFGATSGDKYVNSSKKFESYFLSFQSGCRLEIMRKPGITAVDRSEMNEFLGLTHFAIAVANKDEVNSLTERLRTDGYTIAGEPRTTGDGYYESVVLDPDGNRIEITV
jgi:lactoylglutathione lyase